jgi:D-methionine transport system ATP-binding protein
MLKLDKVNFYTNFSSGKSKENLPGYPILQDISFELNKGDRLGIVGVSGAGKTSLLRIINRLNELNGGKILIEGKNYQEIPILNLRQQVTLVGQETRLLGMTTKEALTYPLKLRGLSKQEIQQRLGYWLEKLHIPNEWLQRTEVQLSQGQRQLVSMARALIIQPKILLLDEPTSASDLGTAEKLIKILTEVNINNEVTTLMVNHQLELIQKFSSHILHLHSGKAIRFSPAKQVDWLELRQSLIDSQSLIDEEWG